jgi:hypothetical protein
MDAVLDVSIARAGTAESRRWQCLDKVWREPLIKTHALVL